MIGKTHSMSWNNGGNCLEIYLVNLTAVYQYFNPYFNILIVLLIILKNCSFKNLKSCINMNYYILEIYATSRDFVFITCQTCSKHHLFQVSIQLSEKN